MSVPWFPFHREKFLSDTLALDAEAVGAYLLMMLHIYSTEAPLPNNDRQLATITRLGQERWHEVRPILEPFFQIGAFGWRHTYCDDVLRDVHATYDAKKSRTAAATAARLAKANATKDVTSTPRGPSRPKTTPRAPDVPRHVDVTSDVGPHVTFTQEQIQEQEVVEIDSTTSAPVREAVVEGLGVAIDVWMKTQRLPPDIPHAEQVLFQKFVVEKRDHFSHDWQSWWERWRAAEIEKAKPKPPRKRAPARVEVNTRPEPVPATRSMITEEAYALSAQMFEVIGIDAAHPKAYGMPMVVQAWLSAWDPGVILQTIKSVCANRDFGDNPPTAKYFEAAIARAHADMKRQVPVAKPGESHARATGSNLADAAARLAARLSPDDGVSIDGGANGDNSVRLLQAR